jgi:hypothetical protein
MKIAVCAHVYYLEQCDFIRDYLLNIEQDFLLYVTCSSQENQKLLKHYFQQCFNEVEVVVVENLGMDIYPFLYSINNLHELGVEIVCKIHTKNTKSTLREKQRELSFDSVLGSSKQINNIINAFKKSPKLLNVGSGILFRSADSLMYGNRSYYQEIINKLALDDSKQHGFFVGTMFWIRLSSLLNLVPLLSYFKNKFIDEQKRLQTGGDGSTAHALERILGLTTQFESGETTLFSDRIMSENVYEMNFTEGKSIHSGVPPVIDKMFHVNSWYNALIKRVDFDENYYRRTYDIPADINALVYYLLIGETEGDNPNVSFSSQNYYCLNPDVLRAKTSALHHYIANGKKEGRYCSFEEFSWSEYCLKNNLYDKESYEDLYPLKLGNIQFQEYGNLLQHSPSSLCKFFSESVMPMAEYAINYQWDIHHKLDSATRAFQNGDYEYCSKVTDDLIDIAYPTQFLYCLSAISKMRLFKWSEAKLIWQRYFKLNEQFNLQSRFSWPSVDQSGVNNFDIIEGPTAEQKVNPKNYKICIYTTLFGGFDDLLPPLVKPLGIDFICFTDTPMIVEGWDVKVINPNLGDDNRNAKIFKVQPHQFLSDYDYSLFVDANTLFTGNVGLLVNQYLLNRDFVMWHHPERSDIYTEAEVILQILRHEPAKIIDQIEEYHKQGLPKSTGMMEASFIWREHNKQEIIELMDEWWSEICSFSKRDQLSLGFLLWKNSKKPKVLPEHLGTSRKNFCFEKLGHRKGHFQSVFTNEKEKANTFVKLTTGRRNLVFLYNDKYRNTGSTIMRGSQLSSLAKTMLGDQVDISYSPILYYTNSILFLTKGVLKEISSEELSKLKKLGNKLLFDFVDDIPRDDIIEFADVLVAASISSYLDYVKNYQDKKVSLITHHVDPRLLKYEQAPPKALKIGYIGELVNTYYSEKIASNLDFISVDTSKNTDDWLEKVPKYNLHYALRRIRGIDGCKPFLKGFTAAAFGANMIIQRNQKEALYYLTEDYPYIYDGELDENSICDYLDSVRDSYLSNEWFRGIDIMNDVASRSSNERVISELKAAIS